MHGWQEQWDAFNQHSAEPRRQAEVQQSRIAQLEQSLERLAERQRRLSEELQQLAGRPGRRGDYRVERANRRVEISLEDLQKRREQQAEQLAAAAQ